MSTPSLFDSTETLFTTAGLGGLGAATSCKVTRQLNGIYELEMDYPIIGRRHRDLVPRNIILASVGPDEQPQPFRIYRTRLSLLLRKKVYARHIAYDLMGCPIPPFPASTLDKVLNSINWVSKNQGFPFELTADFTSDAQCGVSAPRSVWSMLGGQQGSLIDVYGGEWNFDRFSLTLMRKMGEDLGVVVRCGHNLLSLTHDENLANTWTAVYPFWQSVDGLTVVTLPEKMISTGEFNYTRILVWDASAEFQDPPTADQLRARTEQYVSSSKTGSPDIALDASWVPLDQTEEYKGLNFPRSVHLGDTVTMEYPTAADPDTGAPMDFVRAAARVVEYVWLPLQDKYEYVRVGSKRANFATIVAQQQKTLGWVLSKVGGIQ